MAKYHSSKKEEMAKVYKKKGEATVVIQPPSQAEDARLTFVALYRFKYSLRRLLNRLINLRMIAVSEGVREHGVHLAKGRPEHEPSDLWDELPELLRFRSSSELYLCAHG